MSNEAVDLVKRARANWDDCIALGDYQYPSEGDGRRLTPYVCDCLRYAGDRGQWNLVKQLQEIVQNRIGIGNESAACVVFPDQDWYRVDSFSPELIAYRNELWDMLILAAEAMDEGDLS